MKSEYEKDRERLTPREREEVWGRILQRVGGRRVRSFPRLALATAGACALVAFLFLLHSTQTTRVDLRKPASVVLSENKTAGDVVTPDVEKAKAVAPGGAHQGTVTPATPAGPSRDAAVPPTTGSQHPITTPQRATMQQSRPSPKPVSGRRPDTTPQSGPTQQPVTPPLMAAAPEASGETPSKGTGGADAESRSDAGMLARATRTLKNGDITGTVRDSTGKAIAYANIAVVGTSLGVIADSTGRFTIRDIPAGTYELTATAVGYRDQTTEVHVASNKATAVYLTILEKPVPLDLVEITAAREIIHKKSAETRQDIRSYSLPLGASHDRGSSRDQAITTEPRTWGHVPESSRPAPVQAPPPAVYPTTGGSTLPNDEVYDSMYFEHYGVNPFIATDDDSLSTFAVDVDAASYTVARRYIDEGHLPPKEAVRVEEYVNFFRQDYPDFTDSDFRIYLEGAPSPFGKGYELLRIGLKARSIGERDRRPATLVFVIDHSGSMAREDRLELVKEALHILVDQLNPDDRIGLVTYDTGGQVLLEPTSLEDRDGRERILDAIDRLQPGGSTNAAEGLKLGYEMARRSFRQRSIDRIILCTDGVANEGVTGAESILEEVRHEADRGIELTAIGFGMGNYNDVLLEKLADKGDGNYYYVDRLDEARRIFIEKLTGTIQTIAKDAKVQVAFDPHRVLRYRLLGFENRDVADRDFRNDKVDAGEIGAGHEVTALYELKLADSEDAGTIASVHVRYARPDGDGEGGPDVREIQRAFDARDLSRSLDRTSPRFRLDAAVAEFAEILRRSFWAKESRISDVLPLARSAAEQIPGDPDVQEFVRIVEKAADLSDKLSPQEQRERESYDMPWSTEKTLRGDRPNGER